MCIFPSGRSTPGRGVVLLLHSRHWRAGRPTLNSVSSTFHPTEFSPPRRLNGKEAPKIWFRSCVLYTGRVGYSQKQMDGTNFKKQNKDVSRCWCASTFVISFPFVLRRIDNWLEIHSIYWALAACLIPHPWTIKIPNCQNSPSLSRISNDVFLDPCSNVHLRFYVHLFPRPVFSLL